MESRRIAPARVPDTPGARARDTPGGGLDLLARALRAVQAARAAQVDGPSTPHGDVTFMVEHAGHIIARGTVTVGGGHLTSGEVPRLKPGGYTVTLMAGHGQDNQVLLRESIALPADDEHLKR